MQVVFNSHDSAMAMLQYHIYQCQMLYFSGVGRHGMEVGHLPAVSPDPVVFPSLDDISGRASYPMIKAHGKIEILLKEVLIFLVLCYTNFVGISFLVNW